MNTLENVFYGTLEASLFPMSPPLRNGWLSRFILDEMGFLALFLPDLHSDVGTVLVALTEGRRGCYCVNKCETLLDLLLELGRGGTFGVVVGLQSYLLQAAFESG